MPLSKNIRVAYAAIAIFILSVLAFQYKVVFLNWDTETGKFTTNNVFFDDGGMYASILHVFQEGDRFTNQVWFKAIRDNISQGTLLMEWGQWAPRIKNAFYSHGLSMYSAWMQILVFANKFVGDINLTFTVSLLFFPAFLFLKYFVLLPIFVRKPHLLLVMATNLFYDVSSIPSFQSGEIFANQVFLVGLSSIIFGKQERVLTVIGWGFLLGSSFFDIVVIPAVLAVVLGHLFYNYSPIRIEQKYFLLILIGCIVMTYLAAASWLVHDVFEYGKLYYNGAVRIFNKSATYDNLRIIFLLLLVHYIPIISPSLNSRRLEKIKCMILVLFVGGVFFVLIGRMISLELGDNGGRLVTHIFIILLFGLGAIYENLKERRLQNVAAKITIALIIFSYTNFFLSSDVLRISKYVPFEVTHFPAKETSSGGMDYYLARNPQQVHGYFIMRRYDEAPLILDIRAPNYSKEKILADIERQQKGSA